MSCSSPRQSRDFTSPRIANRGISRQDTQPPRNQKRSTRGAMPSRLFRSASARSYRRRLERLEDSKTFDPLIKSDPQSISTEVHDDVTGLTPPLLDRRSLVW